MPKKHPLDTTPIDRHPKPSVDSSPDAQTKRVKTQLAALGAHLKAARERTGMSYEKFAVLNDLSRVTVYRAETGGDLRVSTLFAILNSLSLSPSDFFSDWKEEDAADTN